MDSELIHYYKNNIVADFVIEEVIWKLSKPTVERPHGYKYRLYYGKLQGECIVRYDNKTGKGDHKHLRHLIVPYQFVDPEILLRDFHADVIKFGGEQI